MKTYICQTCGASMLINDNVSFTTCLYCGNNIAICDKTITDLNIKKIIPFEIDKEEAIINFKKLLNKNVIEAKKVYVPVRFCNYDFDFLMYYEYEETDDDNRTSYYDAEDLIDGNVKNDFIFGNSKVNNVYCQSELREKERLDFDPVLLKDVSIEYADFSSKDEIINRINNEISNYSYKKIRRRISKIYSMNYYTSDLDIEEYSTLIPVYIVMTSDGLIHNIPGVRLTKTMKKKKKRKIILTIIVLAILAFSIMNIITASQYSKANETGPMVAMGFLILAVPAILLIYLSARSKKLLYKSYDNYDYKKYSFGDKRKKIK